MSVRHKVARLLNSVLGAFDVRIVRRSAVDQMQAEVDESRTESIRLRRMLDGSSEPSFNPLPLPPEAERYLRADNPRLAELRRCYRSLRHPAMTHSVWADAYVEREVDLRYFRGDNAYVWQFRDNNSYLAYVLTTYYVQRIDHLGLLAKLTEDGLFGAYVFEVTDGIHVSRDSLDSMVEIYFLERHVGITNWSRVNILDIGSGYGRLAHRAIRSLPNLGAYLCVDAVAESTFLAEFYLRFRGVAERANVVPLPEIEGVLDRHPVDVALNIHSFSECTLAAITWWIDLIARHQVRYLMVVPNRGEHGGTRLSSREADGAHLELLPVLESRGYRLAARDPKYLDDIVQAHGISPTYHYLFERVG